MGKVETELELAIYPGQGHRIRDPRLERDLMLRNVEWFTARVRRSSAGN